MKRTTMRMISMISKMYEAHLSTVHKMHNHGQLYKALLEIYCWSEQEKINILDYKQ